jgi:TolB protein
LQLTDNTTDEATPDWSPDGDWIAFASDAESEHEGSYDVYKMRVDGSEITRLTGSDAQEWTPTWSANSSRIAFYRDDKIIVMEGDGSGAARIDLNRQAQNPDWAPSGSRIVFQADHFHSGGSEIHLTRANGAGGKRLTRRDGEDQAPAFSPNGARIAYSRDWNLAIMHRDGTRAKTIHRGRGDVYAPSWGAALC